MKNVLDARGLKEIIGESSARLSNFVTLFETSFNENVSAMEAALLEANCQKLRAHAHSLKGAAASLHAITIKDLASYIEQKSKEDSLDGIAEAITQLKQAMPEYLHALEAFKETLQD